jgi:long-chain acyl-CoA synthetase
MPSYNYTKFLEESINKNWNSLAMANYKQNPITYGQLAEKIYELHSLYEALGIKKGDKIALVAKNAVNWGVVYLATISYGAVIVPLLPDFLPKNMVELINHSDAKLLFVADYIYKKMPVDEFTELEAIFDLTDYHILNDFKEVTPKMEKITEIFDEKYQEKLVGGKFKFPKNKNNQLMIISYTSGSSGAPKGVMLSHGSIGANVWFARKYMPIENGSSILSFLPLAHAYGCAFEFLYPLTIGCFVTYLGQIPSPKIIIKAFDEIKPRLILSVPLVVEKIYKKQIKPKLQDPKVKTALKLPIVGSTVRKKINKELSKAFGGNFAEIIIGGAALNPEVEEFFKKIKFGFTTGYGMTECGPLISYSPYNNRKVGGAGRRVDTVKVKINSHDKYNEPGEIMVKGDNVMMGYYKNEALTKQTITPDGWLKTGDLGVLGKDGTIFIRGRSKSMILGPSGQNIFPEEIEAMFNSYDLVSDSLVVERDGRLVALIEKDKEQIKMGGLDEDAAHNEIYSYLSPVNEALPSYMHIAKIEILEGEFEKTPKNSIRRFLYTTPNHQVHTIRQGDDIEQS